jgi:hypothetical protein
MYILYIKKCEIILGKRAVALTGRGVVRAAGTLEGLRAALQASLSG